ncbi:hypothetical protein [Mycoavidus sp. B2-EB]|uniref:hypothetical protein n=1 Tax=Mycoavidus sp. B2-EB TaxID=2651972 RepID=UPI001625F6A8|nr:hypothetical protein [Mycoavidus sp. B2-EB]BBO59837.1 hypothetical protein MPB2EB_0963 [Mycoavidus sp. B2-EB]
MRILSISYDEVCKGVCSVMLRSEMRAAVKDYINGLLPGVERKNGCNWQKNLDT